jgi:hypothetical protein
MVKKRLIIFSVIFSLLFLCSCTNKSSSNQTEDGDKQVATVNGEIITENEMKYFSLKLRSSVINEFISEYGLEFSDSFWDTEVNGKTPQETLDERALDECVKAKIQLVLCREQGIYDDISYEGLYKKAIEYNESHSGKSNAAGVKTISLEQFYSYYLDNGVMELKNKLRDTTLAPSDEEISNAEAELKQNAKESLSDDELLNAAKSSAVDKKYDEYISGLCKRAKLEKTSEQ